MSSSRPAPFPDHPTAHLMNPWPARESRQGRTRITSQNDRLARTADVGLAKHSTAVSRWSVRVDFSGSSSTMDQQHRGSTTTTRQDNPHGPPKPTELLESRCGTGGGNSMCHRTTSRQMGAPKRHQHFGAELWRSGQEQSDAQHLRGHELGIEWPDHWEHGQSWAWGDGHDQTASESTPPPNS